MLFVTFSLSHSTKRLKSWITHVLNATEQQVLLAVEQMNGCGAGTGLLWPARSSSVLLTFRFPLHSLHPLLSQHQKSYGLPLSCPT